MWKISATFLDYDKWLLLKLYGHCGSLQFRCAYKPRYFSRQNPESIPSSGARFAFKGFLDAANDVAF